MNAIAMHTPPYRSRKTRPRTARLPVHGTGHQARRQPSAACRRTGDPPTLWRGRPVTWSTVPLKTLLASLPRLAIAPFRNRDAVAHPTDGGIALTWPRRGALTTPARRAWSTCTLGAGNVSHTVEPAEAADAFTATVAEAGRGAPARWDTGWTEHGDWWALRAAYGPTRGRAAAGGAVEAAVTVQHEVCAARLTATASWRFVRTGAEIVCARYEVQIGRGRIRCGRHSPADTIDAAWTELDNTAALLGTWAGDALERRTLAAWAATVAAARYGREVPAQLMTRYDRRRWSADCAPGARPAPLDTVRDLAWTIAELAGGTPEIDYRQAVQAAVIDDIAELPWWDAPTDPDGIDALKPDPSLVH